MTEAHRFAHTQGHRSFLRISEHNVAMFGVQSDLKIKQNAIRSRAYLHDAIVRQQNLSIRKEPFIFGLYRADHSAF